MSLPARLQLISELVPAEGAVADIGSGHGALAAALAARGQRVIATELWPHTLASLRRDLARTGVAVETRMGEGLAALVPGEVEALVLAGLGGRSVIKILEASDWLPPTMVLQPAQDADMVRDWIGWKGWPYREASARQRGRDYTTFVVEPGA